MIREIKILQGITNRDDKCLNSYLYEVSKIPALSVEEETELGYQLKKGGRIAEKAKEKLIISNLRFVISVAKQYQATGIPLIDLIEEGNIGLIKAVEKFDESRGFKFISYAVWWIRQSIMSSLTEEKLIRLPQNKVHTLLEEKEELEKLMQETQHEFHELPETNLHKITVSRLDLPTADDSQESVIDHIGKCDNESEYDLEDKLKDIIYKIKFSSKEKENVRLQNITMKYLHLKVFEDLGESSIRAVIADEYGLTVERARQLIVKNILKLRNCPAIIALIA